MNPFLLYHVFSQYGFLFLRKKAVYYTVRNCVKITYAQTEIEQSVLNRKNKIGNPGRNILHLKESLRAIVKNIHTKSRELESQTIHIETVSQNVYQVMKEVKHSTQEMTASCSAQAEDANEASIDISHT